MSSTPDTPRVWLITDASNGFGRPPSSCARTVSRSVPNTRTFIALNARSGCQRMRRRWRASASSSGRISATPGTHRYRQPIRSRTRTRGSRWMLRTYPGAGSVLGDDPERVAGSAVAQLPLDGRRATEARIEVAFAARAATSPALAGIQRTVLAEINEALTEAFALAAARSATAEQCRLAALVAVAAADGLALHAVSSGGWLATGQLTAALELLLDALMLRLAPGGGAGRVVV